MAESLGYHYDRTLLRRGAYTPEGYDEADMSQLLIRRTLTEVLLGIRPIPIRVVEVPCTEEPEDSEAPSPETGGENSKTKNGPS